MISSAGAIAALLLSQLVKSMLYGIRPDDPATMAAGALILLAVHWLQHGFRRGARQAYSR